MHLNNKEEDGGFWLPNIQRPFVWTEDQICRLFDSILREYPISTLLVWKTQSSIRSRKFIDNWRPTLRLSDFFIPENTAKKCLKFGTRLFFRSIERRTGPQSAPPHRPITATRKFSKIPANPTAETTSRPSEGPKPAPRSPFPPRPPLQSTRTHAQAHPLFASSGSLLVRLRLSPSDSLSFSLPLGSPWSPFA
jgi:hypothetical protein